MPLTIEQIEQQIFDLQKTLETLKNPKLEVSRYFTGQYFAPYQGTLYRRMESDGVSIWETYLDLKKEWVLVETRESRDLEKTYLKDCVSNKKETPQESLEEFMK
jgi:hypothetical protein